MHAGPWLLLAALLAAGCYTDAPVEAQARLGGTFTEQWSSNQTAQQDFHATVAKYGATAAIMESFPEQFAVTLAETDCFLLRTELEDKPYVASIGACQKVATGGGNQPSYP